MIAEPLEKGLAEDIENEVVQITWNRYDMQPSGAGPFQKLNWFNLGSAPHACGFSLILLQHQ